MKIVVAPDSFKGSLSAKKICDITEGIAQELFSNLELVKIPMADGGEGTVEAVLDALDGHEVTIEVQNPLGYLTFAHYGIFHQTKAIMEMASASGITKVADEERNIMKQNTFGTGQLVLDALNRGIQTIYLGIGGSATNDGGIGFAQALGAKFLDINGMEVTATPENFEKIVDINIDNLDPRLQNLELIVMCDVTNPLIGEKGATHVFGKQKGATKKELAILERGMGHLAHIYANQLGKNIKDIPGTGAAGGLGAGLLVFTNASMKSGISTIMEILSLEAEIENADLVITGEGMMDYQSAYGKVASGVGLLCQKHFVPCIAIVGAMGKDAETLYDYGITSIQTTVNSILSLDKAIQNAEILFASAVRRSLRVVKAFHSS